MSALERIEMVAKQGGRRGLLAGVLLAMVGLLTRVGEQVVEAAPLTGDSTTSTPGITAVNTTTAIALAAVSGQASPPGLGGPQPVVYAFNNNTNQKAIRGSATGPSSIGVEGVGGFGVLGSSLSGIGVLGSSQIQGVRGDIPVSSAANAIAIYALNNSSFAGPSPGAGGFAVYGTSAKGHGLVGAAATAGAAAVVGTTSGVADAWAGAFYGQVFVGGDFLVVGGAKSAAVPCPDGTHRQLYCVESPESWFEDFGTGQLVNGRAEISIEPGFAAVAAMDNYHVFLTGYDHDHLLHVSKRTAKSFTVEANAALARLQGQTKTDLSGSFSWRVVAKRKDIVGERLAKVTVPPEPVLPPIEDCTRTMGNVAGLDGATR